MLFSVVALLAIVDVALSASPAQATYCSEDNLLRAFQHTPTMASKYCTATTGYPTFLAISSYPPTRLSSACSCFSRFPSETTSPPSLPSCVRLNALSYSYHYPIDITIKFDLNKPCSPISGNKIIAICGKFNGQTVTFNPSDDVGGPDNCYSIGSSGQLSNGGLNFEAGGDVFNLYDSSLDIANAAGSFSDFFQTGIFQSASCSGTCF